MKTELRATKNDLPETTRRDVVQLLNQRLADVIDLRLQSKQAHWNVNGPHFIGLHELFDKIGEELDGFTDQIAERAVELGGVALGTLQATSIASQLTPYPMNIGTSEGHVSALSDALAKFGSLTRAAIDATTKAGDAVTADLFTEVTRGVDKLTWMVEAHAGDKSKD